MIDGLAGLFGPLVGSSVFAKFTGARRKRPKVEKSDAGKGEAWMRLNVNGADQEVDAPNDMPLLWVLRDLLGLTGTKYGCGMSLCGVCTVHVDGEAVRSCSIPVSNAVGRKITTIEGLSKDGSHPVQRAWIDLDVVQCGYCQPGQIMATAALLSHKPRPNDAEIDAALSGNICRCGTYERIRAAVKRAAEIAGGKP